MPQQQPTQQLVKPTDAQIQAQIENLHWNEKQQERANQFNFEFQGKQHALEILLSQTWHARTQRGTAAAAGDRCSMRGFYGNYYRLRSRRPVCAFHRRMVLRFMVRSRHQQS